MVSRFDNIDVRYRVIEKARD